MDGVIQEMDNGIMIECMDHFIREQAKSPYTDLDFDFFYQNTSCKYLL